MAGQSVGLVTAEQPVAAIIAELVDQAVAALLAGGNAPEPGTALRRGAPERSGVIAAPAARPPARDLGARRRPP